MSLTSDVGRRTPERPIAITYGDPAGVGPDLVLTLPDTFPDAPLVVIGDRHVLAQRAKQLGLAVTLSDWQPGQPLTPGTLPVWHTPAGEPVIAGQPDPATASGTLTMLTRAAQGCLNGTFAAMVTAPVAKNVICEGADPAFTGHTEFLAEQAGVDQVVMMLTARQLRVALVTTHLPLSQVAGAVTADTLTRTLTILRDDLISKYRIPEPRILVLGLKPWRSCATRACCSPARCRRIPPSSRTCWHNTMRCWPCTTIRVCPSSSTPALAKPSISPWGCPLSAPRWIMAPLSTWLAPARPRPAA